jgi:hypothetical protein
MLIEKYDLEVFTPPCDPGAERYAARARLTVDISEVLPYLNATLRGAIYHPGANALTWKKGGHNIAFHAYEIAASNVEDREGAARPQHPTCPIFLRRYKQTYGPQLVGLAISAFQGNSFSILLTQ